MADTPPSYNLAAALKPPHPLAAGDGCRYHPLRPLGAQVRVNPLDTTDFTPGRPVELAPGIRRLVADNAGMMTGPGTNTYLIGRNRVVVVDPGPALPGRVEAIERALSGTPVDAVVVTHTHNDHSPAAAPLAAKLGVPLLGEVPLYPPVMEGGDGGRPIVLADPTCSAARKLTAIAEKL